MKLQIKKTNQEKVFEIFDLYYDHFSIKKIPLKKNQRRISAILKKKKKYKSFDIWSKLPYSILIYTSKIRFFHIMENYFYKLKDGLIIRKQRYFYKKDYQQKDLTSFFTYKIYFSNFYKLYTILEEINEYEINILGVEINKILYPIEILPNYLKSIKQDLQFFLNIINDFNTDFCDIVSDYNKIDTEYQQNFQDFLILCQHTTK